MQSAEGLAPSLLVHPDGAGADTERLCKRRLAHSCLSSQSRDSGSSILISSFS